MPLNGVGRGGARAAQLTSAIFVESEYLHLSLICFSSVLHLFLICLSSVLAERQFGSRALPKLSEPGQPSPTTPSRQQWRARWVAMALRHGRVGAVEEYLAEHHKGTWHITLNNHASKRPCIYGGATGSLCDSM